MASEVSVANRALQKVGAQLISSLDDNSKNARAVRNAFASVRDSLLRRHPWNFAIKRVNIAADVAPPIHGYRFAYTRPSDWIRYVDEDVPLPYAGYLLEGDKILMNGSGNLSLRYVARITDVNKWDVLFQEAMAANLALEICEELTQSNTKKDDMRGDFEQILREAKKANAWEQPAIETPVDPWVLARLS